MAPINVTTSKQQITASVAEDKISANVSAGFGATGPQGPSGVITVTAPITNAGTTTAANVGLSVGTGLTVSGGALVLGTHTHDDRYYTETEVDSLLSGYATLVGGKVPSSQLPSYVDDVIEVATYGDLPSPGESGKIYLVIDTNKVYRWTGFVWLEIVASPGSTDSLAEGSVNLYFTNVRAAAAAPVQSVAGKTGAVVLAAGDIASGTLSASRLPLASSGTRGAVRIGSGISIDGDGVISVSTNYAATSHTHGNITNDGKVGTAADKVLVTTSAGAVTAASSITFSQVADTATYTNFSTTPGNIGAALSDIDSAISGKANASDFDQGVTTTDSPEFAGVEFNAYTVGWKIEPRSSLGATFDFKATLSGVTTTVFSVGNNGVVSDCSIPWSLLTSIPSTFAPSAHKTSHATGGSDALSPSDIGAASTSHAHSAADITSGTVGTARLGSGTASSSTWLRGDSSWQSLAASATTDTTSASNISSGTLAKARLPVVMEQTESVGNSGTSKTFSLSTGSVQTMTLTGNCTVTMPTATAGASITLILTQGSSVYTCAFTGVKWPGGTAPTITATANAIDVLVFVSDGTNWYGVASQKFS